MNYEQERQRLREHYVMSERYDPNNRWHRKIMASRDRLDTLEGKLAAYITWLEQDRSRQAYVFPRSKSGRCLRDRVGSELFGMFGHEHRVHEVDPRDYDGSAPVAEPTWADEHLVVLHVA